MSLFFKIYAYSFKDFFKFYKLMSKTSYFLTLYKKEKVKLSYNIKGDESKKNTCDPVINYIIPIKKLPNSLLYP